ncbi:MAG: hypothetical protein DRJ01_12765 [Bacteroidetes bacterium]|nr:MAG: hypothetical protein DRJ01_12765 [Bacteroidota bacterium]
MVCNNCGIENKDSRIYCLKCGEPLGWICDCSFINEPEALYCGGCGKKNVKDSSSLFFRKSIIGELIPLQLSRKQIYALQEERILIHIEESEEISQSDIDKFF